ncbi:MAG: hypothetical protein IT285_10855 [Bdellovibrionales bacterium]|nr:hypothetical protein [Bdellovibrionales bacterium]
MADDQAKKPADQPAPPPADPGAEARARVDQLRADTEVLAKEVKILEGRLRNRDPAAIAEIQKENAVLREKGAKLQRALHALLADSFQARQGSDLELELEAIREAAVSYLKAAGIEEGIWKDIVS